MSKETPLLAEQAGNSCRVCFLGNDAAEQRSLLAPCLCDGSIRYIHQDCLNEWRICRTSLAGKCELCNFIFVYELEQNSRARAFFEMLWPIASPSLFYIMTFGSVACIVAWRRAGPAFVLQVLVILAGDVSFILGALDLVRSIRSRRGHGVLGKLCWQLYSVSRLPRPHVQTRAKMLAQIEASRLTEALALAVRASRLRLAEEEETTAAAQGSRDHEEVRETAEIGIDTAATYGEADQRWTCWSLQCCVEVVCFLATPPVLALLVWAFNDLVNQHLLLCALVSLAIVGGTYVVFVLAVFVIVFSTWPHMTACRDKDGFPIIRSLTSDERSGLEVCGHEEL